jgi:hypothetical protein
MICFPLCPAVADAALCGISESGYYYNSLLSALCAVRLSSRPKPLRDQIFGLFSCQACPEHRRRDSKVAKATPSPRLVLVLGYVLIGLALSTGSRNARPVTTANTMFIGIMMPLKASIGTVTSVPAK